jgi:hypothetical protein
MRPPGAQRPDAYGTKPNRHQDKVRAQAIQPLLVMPGLDPGTPTAAGIRGDHRVKPGDDDAEEWRFGQNNSPPDPYPDAYGTKPGHDEGKVRRLKRENEKG